MGWSNHLVGRWSVFVGTAAEQRESNELVAEFMLLANMSVAQLIGSAFRDNGLLRRHQTPEERKMGELEEAAEKLVCSGRGAAC